MAKKSCSDSSRASAWSFVFLTCILPHSSYDLRSSYSYKRRCRIIVQTACHINMIIFLKLDDSGFEFYNCHF